MGLGLDYKVRCPRCDSDSIFTLADGPTCKLPVRASRECRHCGYKFYTKFDKITADVVSLAKASVFKGYGDEFWSSLYITGVYESEQEAIDATVDELVSECTN